MTGRVMRTPLDTMVPALTEGQLREVSRDKFIKQLQEQLILVNWQAANNMGAQHRRNRLLLEPRTTHEWAIGDQVMVRNFTRVGVFEPLYAGLHNIVDKASPMVYTVQLPRRVKWFHLNQCKLFDPTRAGKSRKEVRAREINVPAPVEVEAVGEIPDHTISQPVATCCPCLAVQEVVSTVRPTVIQAPSPDN